MTSPLAALDQQQDAETIVQVRRRHADVLIANGDREEAVDELLRIGDVDAAARLAAGELPSLMARMDLAPGRALARRHRGIGPGP